MISDHGRWRPSFDLVTARAFAKGGGTIDPTQAAATQQTYNDQSAVKTAELNQTNQVTPYGSLTYKQTGTNPDGTPQYTATTALTPQAQAVYDQTLSNQGAGAAAAGSLLSTSNLGQAVDTGNAATQARLDALNRTTLDPQWQQQSDQLNQSLYNRGITPGTQAYDTAMRDFGQQKDDAYNTAYLNDYSTVNQQALAAQAGNVNAYNALQSGSQVASPTSSFVSTPQTQDSAANYTSLVNSYNQQQIAQQNSMMGGLFGIGSALVNGGSGGFGNSALGGLFALSDARVKADISVVGRLDNGLPVYAFRYKSGGPMQIGLMAQDVEAVRPEAVREIGGLKHVDYGRATEA